MWIPIDKKPPKIIKNILVTIESQPRGRWIAHAWLGNRGDWYYADSGEKIDKEFKIIAWQQLPEPYNGQEHLFREWMNLTIEIQMLAGIIQNPLDKSETTSIDLAEWKTQYMNFEEKCSSLKQRTEKFIIKHLARPKQLKD